MTNPLITKLGKVADLSADDREALERACAHTREVSTNRDIIREGTRPDFVHLMLEGWACRYKVLPDGSRQITAYLIPGDFCDLHVTVLGEVDHSIAALTPARVAYISHEAMDALVRERPEVSRALLWATLVDEGVLRAWIVNIGRRRAFERVAHLMCEMYERMKHIDLVADGEFNLPLTQIEIADTLGLTSVHVNRVIQRLRAEELITFRNEQLAILDPQRLKDIAGFDANYLHAQPVRSG